MYVGAIGRAVVRVGPVDAVMVCSAGGRTPGAVTLGWVAAVGAEVMGGRLARWRASTEAFRPPWGRPRALHMSIIAFFEASSRFIALRRSSGVDMVPMKGGRWSVEGKELVAGPLQSRSSYVAHVDIDHVPLHVGALCMRDLAFLTY